MQITQIGPYPLSPECIHGGVEASVYGLVNELVSERVSEFGSDRVSKLVSERLSNSTSAQRSTLNEMSLMCSTCRVSARKIG